MDFIKTTESESLHNDLETLDVATLVNKINEEDKKVALAVEKCLPEISALIEKAVELMSTGGRLFYIGAGTSGRLGILDASECPPTFGVAHDKIIAIIAGGDIAIRKAVENAEDDTEQAFKDLLKFNISKKDMVIGIAASGTTPYVVAGLKQCIENDIQTGAITCNINSPLYNVAHHKIAITVGAEFITGSSRMKAGTAQKMVLNMISTAIMVKLGHVKGNRMVDMQLSNDKLVDRGTRMIMETNNMSYDNAQELLKKYGSVRAALASTELC